MDEALREAGGSPCLLWFPTSVLYLIMICFSLFGDGLRDALDPRTRR